MRDELLDDQASLFMRLQLAGFASVDFLVLGEGYEQGAKEFGERRCLVEISWSRLEPVQISAASLCQIRVTTFLRSRPIAWCLCDTLPHPRG